MLTLEPRIPSGRLSESRLEELATRARAGEITQEEKQELTGAFVRLVQHIAKHLARSDYNRMQDYVSCGLFGIAYAIRHAQEKMHDQNISLWIIANIRCHIARFRRRDHTIRVPSSTWAKAKKSGLPIPKAPSVYSLSSSEPCSELSNIYELREILGLCARDQLDLDIIRLRSQRYTDTETAERLGVGKSHVQRRRRDLEARFNAMIVEDL